MAIRSVNPTTGEVWAQYEEHSASEVAKRLFGARRAFHPWRQWTVQQRADVLKAVARALERDKQALAELMAREMGKPVAEGRAEVERCAWGAKHYAETGADALKPEKAETSAAKSMVVYEPLGTVLAVMPWNFPLWQVFRFAAPAFLAGNTGVLKHASNVPGCAQAIESLWQKAGLPDGGFPALFIGSDRVGDVIDDPRIAAVTLTGSSAAGREVAARAGRALKKTVLELGGSDPYIVLEDADLDLAADVCVKARMLNAGQSCIAAKRWIVVDKVRKDFTEKAVERMAKLKVGDPLDPATEVGPLARHDLRDQLHDQVKRSVPKGAKILLGGVKPDGPGAFYPATVLDEVKKGMPAYDEELFGPVATIIAAKSETDALRIANDTEYGLGACVITGDKAKGERIARHDLEAGMCGVNLVIRSDPRVPFGGIKASGYGRELGQFGVREFTNVKTVMIA